MSNSKENQKKTVHATISDESFEIIEKYKGEYGSKSAVVDTALRVFKKFKKPYLDEVIGAWSRARNELNMVLVGKTTLLSYLSGDPEKAQTKNIALEAIEWYLGKSKEEMEFEEFLNGLKGMWHIANYFYNTEIDKNREKAFQMTFKHDLTKEFSEFWAEYFKILLTKHWNCSVMTFIRNESFHLIIREN